jgi:hypothetical protein
MDRHIIDEGKMNHLYRYCRSKGVRYYDIQAELADHLADAIEKLGAEKPALGFYELLDEVDAQFAPGEFAAIVRNKSWLLTRQYWKLYRKELFSFFAPPRLFLLISVYVLFFLFRSRISSGLVLSTFFSVFLILLIIYFVRQKRWTILQPAPEPLPLLSLKRLEWLTAGIIIVSNTFLQLVMPHIGVPGSLAGYYLIIAVDISVVHIQYKVKGRIREQYPHAFD